MQRWLLIASLLITAGGCAGEPAAQPESSITILWAQWAPADYLQKLSGRFTRETGIKVVVVQVPWERFYDEFFRSVKQGSGDYDLVGGDSQWLGRGATEGVYTDLTRWIKRYQVDKQMAGPAVTGYAEYPKGSGRYWAVPLMGDAMGFAYRKDLFEDPAEKKVFRARYGYDLGIPKTWEQLRDIAEFFYRPDKNFYGVTVWGSPAYDGITMGVDTLLWAYGGGIGDQQTYHVKGFLDTPGSNKGLEMYKKIHDLGPPEYATAYLEANEAFIEGKVAMVMSFFAFFPDLLDPARNPYAWATGFFANPAGPKARATSLGGQGLSIKSSTKKKELCFKFLQWFVRSDVQREWARLGGFSCDRSVLSSQEFLSAKPYNAPLAESMLMMRDFWVVPEYLELLEVSQKHWHHYLSSDDVSAEQVNAQIAKEWERIFELSGYYKE